MAQWLKTLTGCLCMLTVLMHLVPRGKFSKYVRFYAGLLFFLVAARPVWNLLSGEGGLERLLQLSFLRDSYYDLESSVAGMAELKNDQIMEAYRGEIERQIEETALAYGLAASDIGVTYDAEDGYQIRKISFTVRTAAWGMRSDLGQAQSSGQKRLQDQQGLPGEQGLWDSQQSQGSVPTDEAIEAVKKEIAGVYALDLDLIQIRREEAG